MMNVIGKSSWRVGSPRGILIGASIMASFALALHPATIRAQGVIVGQVVDTDSEQPLSGGTVLVQGTERGSVTDQDGQFTIQGVPAGVRVVEARALGYRAATQSVDVAVGGTVAVNFSLPVRPLELGGIRVEVLRPDLAPRAGLTDRQVREANPKDAGQLLREIDGVDAVRRGPLGLDPVVRGLRETEVGTYWDGTRLFPAGPARMDSPLTHLDPSAVQKIEVVKGPYALTWGAGNMSAIRLESAPLPQHGDETLSGNFSLGYDSNLKASEVAGSLSGRTGGVSVQGHGAWREGSDYESGDGTKIPADFLSWESRGKIGFDVGDNSLFSISSGYQWQEDLDYPGRLLNADNFKTLTVSTDFRTQRSEGLLREFDLGVYRNEVDHQMGNWEKPTAMPMAMRMPPFALDINVDSHIKVLGGRAAAELVDGPWSWRVGGDFYSANRDATRVIQNAGSGMQVGPTDLMWPDATITDVGIYTRVNRTLEAGTRLTGTVRLDQVSANAGTATDFFRTHVSNDLDSNETNLSGAFTAGFDLGATWDLSLGLGSVVRTADASERYSDRIPASKAQMTAEFMGNPVLNPERSTQGDIWLEGMYPKAVFQLNVFTRKISDYITLQPTDPMLPTRLPMSPPTVYQYINGDASFFGGEASLAYGLTDLVTANLSGSYLWGEDNELDEPVLGISPLTGRLRLRYEDAAGRYFIEGFSTAVAGQDRVSTTRNENATDSYITIDLVSGMATVEGVNVRIGIENLFDKEYWNHLNARNPFGGARIPEPGRLFYVDVSYGF
jgi:iron complex outermembrane receptor protein